MSSPVLIRGDIETQLVAAHNLVDSEATPTSIGVVVLVVGLIALIDMAGPVAFKEVGKVRLGHWVLLQRVVNVRTIVVNPHLSGLHALAAGTVLEEYNVSLYARLVEDTSRQAQDSVQVRGLQQLTAHRLTGTALEQYVVRYDNGSGAASFQDGMNVLNKVQLLVRARCPEVWREYESSSSTSSPSSPAAALSVAFLPKGGLVST